VVYGRIPYLNNDWSFWAIYRFFLRHLLYSTAVWLGASPSVPLTLADLFPDRFFFNIVKWSNSKVRIAYLKKLNKVYFILQNDKNTILVVVDAGIRSNIIISIAYVYKGYSIIKKPITKP